MDYKAILTGLLSTAYKFDIGKVAELLQDGKEGAKVEDVVKSLLEADKERVTELTSRDTGKFQEGFKKGKKESLEELEKAAKEAHKLESDKTGLDLINQIVEVAAQAAAKDGKPKELTEEDIKKSDVYRELDRQYKKDIKAKDEEIASKLEEFKAEKSKEQAQAVIKAKAKELLNELEPDLPSDQTVAANQVSFFLDKIIGGSYEVKENGDIVMLDSEGKVKTNAHGQLVDFKDHVKEQASGHFVFKANNGGGNSGNGGKPVSGSDGNTHKYPDGIAVPKTYEDMMKTISDTSIKPADRQQVMQTWKALNSK